jgi:hypothetical protein
MCADHWAALRKAIDDRGLTPLVARSGEEAMASTVRQLEGQDTKADFDPLMNANWAIFGAFLHDTGIAGLSFEGCPLCEVQKGSGLAEDWINGAADDQLTAARDLGLVPAKQ